MGHYGRGFITHKQDGRARGVEVEGEVVLVAAGRCWVNGGGGWRGCSALCRAEAAEILHVTFAVAGGGEAEGDRTVQKYLNIDYSWHASSPGRMGVKTVKFKFFFSLCVCFPPPALLVLRPTLQRCYSHSLPGTTPKHPLSAPVTTSLAGINCFIKLKEQRNDRDLEQSFALIKLSRTRRRQALALQHFDNESHQPLPWEEKKKRKKQEVFPSTFKGYLCVFAWVR